MKRRFKTFAVAAATIAVTTFSTVPVEACGGRGGGGGGVSFGYGRPVSYAPAYRSYSQPSYSQPSYSQSSYSQPSYSQPRFSQPTFSQPRASQPTFSQPAPAATNSQQVVRANPASSGSIQSNPNIVTNQRNTARASRPQPAPTQRAAQTPTAQAKTTPQSAAPSNSQQQAEASALQMLASLTSNETPESESSVQIPEFTAATSQSVGTHVGSWKVDLPGKQSVELALNAEGRFSWTATKDGKSSSFQGQYRLEEGRLTLVRESDLQQMAGSWSGEGTKFTFKLDGATTSGLAFQRS